MIRFAGLDFLRGFGIVLGLVLTLPQFLPVRNDLLVFWYLLVPLFGLVSGATLMVTALQRSYKHPWQLVYRWTFFHALVLIALGLLGKWVLGQGYSGTTPNLRSWGFLGSLLGFEPWSGWAIWSFSDVVTSLGVGSLFFGLVIRWIFRRDVEKHFLSHWLILGVLALGFSLGAHFSMNLGFSGDFYLPGKFVFHGLFPLILALATLFWGALLGLMLVTRGRSWVFLSSGALSFVPTLTLLILQALGVSPDFVGWGPFLQAINLAFLFNFSLIILKAAHPELGKTAGWFRLVSRPLRPYGRLPLTIFLLAPLSAMGLSRIIQGLGVSWSQVPLWGLVATGVIFALVWGGILVVWKKVSYRGSPDWLVQYVLRWTGKPSSRLLFLQDDTQ